VLSSSASAQLGSAVIYRRLLGYAQKYWGLAFLALLGMLIEALAAGAFTAMMNPLVNQTFVDKNPNAALWLPLAIVSLFLMRGLATFVTDYGMARIGRGVVQTLREQVMAKYLVMPSHFFDYQPTAGLVSNLTYHTEQVAQASADSVKIVITDVVTLLALLAVMFYQSPRVTLTMLVIGPIIALLVAWVGRRYRRINRQIQDSVSALAHVAEEAITAQDAVKVYGGQHNELERFHAIAERNRSLQVKVEVTKAMSSSLVQLLAAIALAIIVWIAGREAMMNRLSPGAFVSLMTAMMAMLPTLKRMTNVQGMIQKGVAAATTLFQILDAKQEVDTGTRTLVRAAGKIEFKNVSVHYHDGSQALDRVSLIAQPGTMTAIVGRSGSGKSTLVRLISRLYEPSEGQVLLDGHRVQDYTLADLRRQIAWVSQDVAMFDDTVAANIAYGCAVMPSLKLIEQAADAAHALEFINRLPDGLQTRIREGGRLLSAGQRQRLAIARAILKDAPILILDEATSALDSESERLIQEALSRVVRQRTTLVIAHRLSTIEHADQVLVLRSGCIVEHGQHTELLHRKGEYARLHQMQFSLNQQVD
jgi:subfamily B ATP-binding cassette protein MsbA